MSQKAAVSKWWALLPTLIAFAYFFPRLLVNTLGPENPWTSYLYLYGFGGIYFGLGILLVRKSSCHMERPRDRFWFRMLLTGFAYFASLHAIWTYLAISIPYLGGQ